MGIPLIDFITYRNVVFSAAAAGATPGPGAPGAPALRPPDLGPPNMQHPPVLQPSGQPFPNVSYITDDKLTC